MKSRDRYLTTRNLECSLWLHTFTPVSSSSSFFFKQVKSLVVLVEVSVCVRAALFQLRKTKLFFRNIIIIATTTNAGAVPRVFSAIIVKVIPSKTTKTTLLPASQLKNHNHHRDKKPQNCNKIFSLLLFWFGDITKLAVIDDHGVCDALTPSYPAANTIDKNRRTFA